MEGHNNYHLYLMAYHNITFQDYLCYVRLSPFLAMIVIMPVLTFWIFSTNFLLIGRDKYSIMASNNLQDLKYRAGIFRGLVVESS